MRQSSFLLVVVACLLALGSGGVQAQGFDAQRFKPAPNQQDNIFTVRSARTLPSGVVELGLMANYANDPLVLKDANDRRSLALISDLWTGDVLASVGILDIWELGVDLPVVLLQRGDDTAVPSVVKGVDTNVAVGDLHVATKLTFFDFDRPQDPGGAGLALVVDGYLPTGNSDNLQGEKLRVAPGLVVDYAFAKGPRLSLEATYRIRPKQDLLGTEVDDAIGVGLGLDVPIDGKRRLHALLEGSMDITVDAAGRGARELPIEALLGLRYQSEHGLMAEGGFGAGLSPGYGAPDYRALLGVGWRIGQELDRDHDGINDDDDACPDDPEDKDGFQDLDGCPDLDNDGDGVSDVTDRCQMQPEDKDGFEDGDGCPDPDNDADGLPDTSDRCPSEAEDKDNFEDEDGCPDRDNDGDGVLDALDKCPNVAEDKDGFEDDDGCPDPDNDQDGIADADDKCPTQAEDMDGFEDDDGCPEPGSGKVRITCAKIQIDDKVYFNTNSDKIQPRSFELLDQVASVLNGAPYIKRVRIEGHSDNRGNDKYNLKLSDRRAASVLRYLTSKGVDASRLESKGFGETQPIADNKTATGRSQNRRVEFVITERDRACNP